MKKRTGWVYPDCTLKSKKKEIINECLDPQPYWDDWNDWRDGMRGYPDRTKYKKIEYGSYNKIDNEKCNRKIKILLKRRQAKQWRERPCSVVDNHM